MNLHYRCILYRCTGVPDGILSILPGVILDEAEAAGSSLELIQSHHHPLHLAALPEQLVDLNTRYSADDNIT